MTPGVSASLGWKSPLLDGAVAQSDGEAVPPTDPRRGRLHDFYPDGGPLRRELYAKHLEFFRLGGTRRERLMLAANRIGKTEGVGGYETALHLTGLYPPWWEGRRFERPIAAWAAGRTAATTRDIIQAKLCGPVAFEGGRKTVAGTGLIPGDLIDGVSWKRGLADAVDIIKVRHVSGGVSTLGFKSFEQGRGAFEGTERDLVWLDEEPDLAVYTECLVRTMTTQGLVLLTFTPLMGMTELVRAFLDAGRSPPGEEAGSPTTGPTTGKTTVVATWDDAPHLPAEERAALWAALPPHQREARSKGVPQLGAGAIYPVPENDIVVAPFAIPRHWPRAYGLDVGWNRTAAVWGALDRETDTLYLYAEHYRAHTEPSAHAAEIRQRGAWMTGAVDPAARGRGQSDGVQVLQKYRELGLNLVPALNAVEAGLLEIWERLSTGRLKVFASLAWWLAEYRVYRRNERGQVVKQDDHLMDATRYLVMTGLDVAATAPQAIVHHRRQPGRVKVDYDPLA